MKKFFVNYGNTFSLALTFVIFNFDLIGDYFPEFSSTLLTGITYGLVALIPCFLGVYYKNKKPLN
tara:strand:- start:3284 stop:3478 length:195 start_codon:yes stop_codon:yes gene_type:complete